MRVRINLESLHVGPAFWPWCLDMSVGGIEHTGGHAVKRRTRQVGVWSPMRQHA